jgi:hypothetical protein
MIQLISTMQLSAAIAKARSSNLFIRPTSLSRQYLVTNRDNGKQYYVDFFVMNDKRFGHCDCEAGQRNIACKHLAAAAALHIGLSAIRRRLQRSW